MGQPPFYFNVCEIAELAAKLEEAGETVYALLVSLTKGRAQKMIRFLSAQEALHKKRFQALARSGEVASAGEYAVDLRLHIAGLIDAVRREVMPKEGGVPVLLSEALMVAYRFEKDSVGVYEIMCGSCRGEYNHILSIVLKEEKAHLNMIEGLINAQRS